MGSKKVMLISTKETLITNGLMNKIKAAGREPYYALTAEDISAGADEDTGVIVYYMNDDAEKYEKVHAALDELCECSGKKVICIATKEQHDILTKSINPLNILNFFERPLNMDSFLECVMEETRGKKKRRVLIVDDDASYRQLVREWLKGSYEVSMANGGTQAITILSAREFDLILLDYEMPIVPGPQVMEMIRSLPQAADVPIVFLTGKNDEASIRRVLELHPAGYLLKTVNETELLKKVEEVLAGA